MHPNKPSGHSDFAPATYKVVGGLCILSGLIKDRWFHVVSVLFYRSYSNLRRARTLQARAFALSFGAYTMAFTVLFLGGPGSSNGLGFGLSLGAQKGPVESQPERPSSRWQLGGCVWSPK